MVQNDNGTRAPGRGEFGRAGEQAAARWYVRHSRARVLGRNVRNACGEIDLVLEEPDGTLVFCEVKARCGRDAPLAALLAVGAKRRRRLVRAAALFLAENGFDERTCRFDVVAVARAPGGPLRVVHHVPCAFWAED